LADCPEEEKPCRYATAFFLVLAVAWTVLNAYAPSLKATKRPHMDAISMPFWR
jgi:hypothetical protein